MASTLTNLLYHVIYSTKHREPLLIDPWREELYAYTGGIVRSLGGTLLKINGVADHVHLVMRLKTEPSIAEIVRTVKAKSSKFLNEHDSYPGRFAWQTGYAAFTLNPSILDEVMAYVANQQEHHRYVSFAEEYRKFLDRHGIEFDERYFLD
jgi:REP element-mobilizing transposase RayT